MLPVNVKPFFAVMLTLLASLLVGCATTSPPSVVEPPKIPNRPELSQQLPSTTYSSSARTDIEAWRKRLTDTSPTSAP
jgi:hypothetical protein